MEPKYKACSGMGYVCAENLNPGVVMMKSVEYRVRMVRPSPA